MKASLKEEYFSENSVSNELRSASGHVVVCLGAASP